MSILRHSCWLIIILFSTPILSQILSGSATVQLTGPATKEQSDSARAIARTKLKQEVLLWLGEQMNVHCDTANMLQMYHFESFIDSCLKQSKEEATFKGKSLVLTFLLPFENAEKALQSYNSTIDTLTTRSWVLLKSAHQGNNFQRIYSEGIKTLSNASARLGPPLAIAENPEKNIIGETRTIMQEFLDKMKVSSSSMILEGKTGMEIQSPPTLKVLADSTPLQGISFTGKLQNGRELFAVYSDENGIVHLSNLKIPFVANGTLLYANLDLGKVAGINPYIKPTDFGLRLKKSQDQSFIFKISRPVYTLQFRASSVSDIAIPQEYANDMYLKKYLKDSCYLQESTGSGAKDLSISVVSQISKYNYDETEEVSLKASCQIIIEAPNLNPPRTKKIENVYEKRYERSLKISSGLFFWEANVKLREALKAGIESL